MGEPFKSREEMEKAPPGILDDHPLVVMLEHVEHLEATIDMLVEAEDIGGQHQENVFAAFHRKEPTP